MKKYHVVLLFFVIAGLSSCLKENPALDPNESNNVVEIYSLVPTPTASPADAIHPMYVVSFNVVPEVAYDISVSYSGAEVAPEDITVNLGLKSEAMRDYNDEQGTHFEVLPTNMYSIDNWTLVIKKGERVATAHLKFFTTSFDLSKSYALPVTILSASRGNISQNFGTVIFNIVAKNKYDGRYKVTGTCVDANGLYQGDYPRIIDLQTVNATTCQMYEYDWDYPNYIVVSIATGGGANSGIRVTYTFDPANDAITRIFNIVNNQTLTKGPATTNYTTARSFNSEWTLGRWHVTDHWEYQGERN